MANPENTSYRTELTLYHDVRRELSIVDGLVLRTEGVVVSAKLTDTFIQLAHESHLGIVKTKQRIREKYWWLCLDKQVKTAIRSCAVCQVSDKCPKNLQALL